MITATINNYPAGLSRQQNVTDVYGTLTFSGNYATGGDAFALPAIPGYNTGTEAPINVFVQGISGVEYTYNVSTQKVLVFEQGTAAGPLPQLAAGAYPAAVTGDSVTFHAIISNS